MKITICPGCGLELMVEDQPLDTQFNASCACRQIYDELAALSLSLRDPDFIQQLVVDSYAAQHSSPMMKPITTAFALIGLYLTFERGYTGKEVQQAHMDIAKKRREWPRFNPPSNTNMVTVQQVLNSIKKDNYRSPITRWGKSVWDMWGPEQENVRLLVDKVYRSGN